MSLAQYASPYNNDDSVDTDNINANIKMTQSQNQGQNRGNNGAKKIPPSSMRKTIKRPPAQAQQNSESQSRVAHFMSKLNAAKNTSTTTTYAQGEDGGVIDESESDLADYHPINQNYESGEQVQNQNSGTTQDDDGVVTREHFENLPSTYARQYYQQYAPYSNPIAANESTADVSKDEILQKMNHIIQMLEDQQDEKTGSVTEEFILYCFLGVFVIFIVDSFARAGKYVR